MYIAIDDTYGPQGKNSSLYVTGARRTHVAVIFRDDEITEVRNQLSALMEQVKKNLNINVSEFHFTDIYNRRSVWKGVEDQKNLEIIEAFANIYMHYRWPVCIQTIDDRTLRDHGIKNLECKVEGLDLSKREDLSLVMLAVTKLMPVISSSSEKVKIYIDEGNRKPGSAFGKDIFRKYDDRVSGVYERSRSEPLLQIADFLAFFINRSTYLSVKANRTAHDNWFLSLSNDMQINCPDFICVSLPANFSVTNIDQIHKRDRKGKGLE